MLAPPLEKSTKRPTQVSTQVALDHQTYSALAQHTQNTWTAQLNCETYYSVDRWRLGLHYNPTYILRYLDQLTIKSPNTEFLKQT